MCINPAMHSDTRWYSRLRAKRAAMRPHRATRATARPTGRRGPADFEPPHASPLKSAEQVRCFPKENTDVRLACEIVGVGPG